MPNKRNKKKNNNSNNYQLPPNNNTNNNNNNESIKISNWFEGIEKKEDITQEIIENIYETNKSPCNNKNENDNCELNVNCHNALGQFKGTFWEESYISECARSELQLSQDPSINLRDEKTLVGLKNLGATCYINSSIQTLFMDVIFREGIFNWRSKSGEEKIKEEIGNSDYVLTQLQTLFAFLQLSNKNFYDPRTFTKMLNIKNNIQQDAQEFSGLFLNFLQEKFSHDKDLDNLIKRFEGEISYLTKCKKCESIRFNDTPFKEIFLPINNCESIFDCFKTQFYSYESLDKDNQIFCEKCDCKTDAIRYQVIKKLPPVLNLQLSRFYFDSKSLTKKKNKKEISFQFQLNMNFFFPDFDENNPPQPVNWSEIKGSNNFKKDEDNNYELTAILIHKGDDPYSGHYVSHIMDPVTKKWYRFDDEIVTEISIQQVGIEENNNNQRKNTSKNGYMMIYTQKKILDSIQPEKERKVDPPVEITRQVYSENDSYIQLIEKYQTVLQQKREKWEFEKKYVEDLLACSTCESDSLEFFWISTSWLKKYLTGEDEGEIDNAPLLCEHKKMDPLKIKSAKRISTKAWEMLCNRFGSNYSLPFHDCCVDCCFAVAKEKQRVKEENDLISKIKQSLKTAITTNPKEISFYYISFEFLNKFKNSDMKEKNDHLDVNASIICPHKNLTCNSSYTRINIDVWSYIHSCYPSSTSFSSENQNCFTCKDDKEKEKLILIQTKESRNKEKNDLTDLYQIDQNKNQTTVNLPPGKFCMLSRQWISNWKDFLLDPLIEDCPTFDNSLFICEHEKLKYNVHPNYLNQDATPQNNSNKFPYYLIPKTLYERIFSRYGDKQQPVKEIVVEIINKNEQSNNHNSNWKTSGKYQSAPKKVPNEIKIHLERCDECITNREFNDHLSSTKFKNSDIVVQKRGKFSNIVGSNGYSTRSKTTFKIKMNADDPISLLKIKVFDEIGLEPSCQKILLKESVLDDEATFFGLDIQPGAMLYVMEIEPEYSSLPQSNDNKTDNENKNQVFYEEGFKGSVFSSLIEEIEENVEEHVDIPGDFNENVPLDPNIWSCPQCTYHNPISSSNCEMCGSLYVKKKKRL